MQKPHKSPLLGNAIIGINDLISLCGKHSRTRGVQDTIGITDDTRARFAIEQSLVRHPTDSVFSSHGRPYFQREGIARWMKHNPDADKWLMSIDNRLVEYDEYQDGYSEVSQVPEDDTITEVPPGGYGVLILVDEALA